MASKMWSSRPTRTGYNGMFGDSFFSDCWDIVDRPSSRTSFGKSSKIINEDVTNDVSEDKIKPMFRKSHLSRLSSDDIYQVMLEVSHFTPSDLSVKLVDEKTVVVEGKHGERKDPQGFISREFTRKYNLPESVKPSSVECYLSADGVLVIRGHADRPRSRNPSSTGHTEQLDHVIPIFTNGYHTQQQQQTSTKSLEKTIERIIPITQEDRYEVTEPSPSGRSSRSSTKEQTPAEEIHTYNTNTNTNNINKNSYAKREQKERTVSFSEEEQESISYDQSYHNSRASTSKASTTATKVPVNVPTPPGPTPTPTPSPMQTEQIHEEVSGRSSRLSDRERQRSPIGSNGFGSPLLDENPEEVFIHSGFDTGTSLMDRRRRHFSLNKEKDSSIVDSDRFFSSKLGNGLGHMDRLIPSFSTRGEDIFDDFGLGLSLSNKWSDQLPLRNREEKYEKTFEKAVKNGHLTETMAERFYSEQYSSSSFSNNKNNNNNHEQLQSQSKEYLHDHGHPMEHRINISSPA